MSFTTRTRPALLALAVGVAVTIGGATASAASTRATVTSADRLNDLASSLQQVAGAQISAGISGGTGALLRRVRSAYEALQPQIEADLPADATPDAQAARQALLDLDKQYVAQYTAQIAHAKLGPAGQVHDVCRVSHTVQQQEAIIRITKRFDAAVATVGAQAGEPVISLSGLSGTESPELAHDRHQVFAVAVCSIAAVGIPAAKMNAALRQIGSSGKPSRKTRTAVIALGTITTHALTDAVAYLAAHKAPSGSPYGDLRAASLAFANDELTFYSGLTEQMRTSRIADKAAWKRAEKAVPHAAAKLDAELRKISVKGS